MRTKIHPHPRAMIAILLLTTACPLLAQMTPAEQLTQAFALVKEGKPGLAVVELRALLDSNSLNAPSSGKAWNILGLAYDDLGEFALSQHAYEESLHILEGLPKNILDYAMALDDFGAFYVDTGQFEVAEKLRTKALGLYEQAQDHGGIARSFSDLAGIAFSQGKVAKGSKYLERAVREARVANNLGDDDRIAIASLEGWKAHLDGDSAMSVVKYRQALDLSKRFHGEEHSFTGWNYLLLGMAHSEAGELTTALGEMRQGVAILKRTLSDQNPRFLAAQIAYSRVLDAAGSHAEAARIGATAQSLLKDLYQRQCAGCTVSAAAFH